MSDCESVICTGENCPLCAWVAAHGLRAGFRRFWNDIAEMWVEGWSPRSVRTHHASVSARASASVLFCADPRCADRLEARGGGFFVGIGERHDIRWHACVCHLGESYCRFHFGGTVTDGPHCVPPYFGGLDDREQLVPLGPGDLLVGHASIAQRFVERDQRHIASALGLVGVGTQINFTGNGLATKGLEIRLVNRRVPTRSNFRRFWSEIGIVAEAFERGAYVERGLPAGSLGSALYDAGFLPQEALGPRPPSDVALVVGQWWRDRFGPFAAAQAMGETAACPASAPHDRCVLCKGAGHVQAL